MMGFPTKYTQASSLRSIALGKLSKSIRYYNSLPIPVMSLLVDQYLLLEAMRRTKFQGTTELVDLYDGSTDFLNEESAASIMYTDFAFLIAPAFKAYEGFLLFLARIFKLPADEYSHRIGGLYDWEANKKWRSKLLKRSNQN